MGIYLNPDSSRFEEAVNSDIYIDKTGLLNYTNSVLHTMQKYICISRPRRFGKSIAANMLAAYYSRGCDARELFSQFEIAESDTFEKHLNQYNTIFVNMQEMLSRSKNVQELVARFQKLIIRELKSEYPEVEYFDEDDLTLCMQDVYVQTKQTFVIIIDEWDVLIRDEALNQKVQDEYIGFLRGLFKGSEPTKYIQLAYLTGILPIKKIRTQSALNNFSEFTMLDASVLAPYIGFTEAEVRNLCAKYNEDYAKVKQWYDGYMLEEYQIYNPKAVVSLMLRGKYKSYWSDTGTYEAVVPLINMDFDGLKTAIIEMISGTAVEVDVSSFQNDTISFANRDDVLTYLIHLGYLGYDENNQTAFIPNEEIRQELMKAVKRKKWNEWMSFQQESDACSQSGI